MPLRSTGHVAIYDGEIRTQEGHGKFVKREANTPVNRALGTWKELTAPRPVERESTMTDWRRAAGAPPCHHPAV